jgi:hypothetical protein
VLLLGGRRQAFWKNAMNNKEVSLKEKQDGLTLPHSKKRRKLL